MKLKITTYLFVFLYLIAMLRPVAPFVEYAVNYDYISKVLCVNKDKPNLQCNGKCHLMKQLRKQQDKDFNSLRVSLEEYPIGFVEIIKFNKTDSFFIQKKENLFKYYQNYKFLALSTFFHPPEIA